MAKKGVYDDLNQLADVLMRKKKKKRRRRKAVKGVPATQAQALQQETTMNAMIRTPYSQQTLYGAGNFNVAGDKFDAGIQADKKIKELEAKYHKEQGDAINRMLKNPIDVPNSELDIIDLGGGETARVSTTRAQTSTKLNRPARPAVSTVGEGIITMGDGIISAEGKQGGGGVASPAPYGFKPDGSPYKRKPKNFGMMTGIAEATPNYQNIILNKQEQKITDVLQGGGGDIGM